MEPREAVIRVDEILDADLEELTEHERLSVFPVGALRDWGLTAAEMRLLTSFGLPPARQDGLVAVSAAFQESVGPSLGGELFQVGAYGVTKLGFRPTDGSISSLSTYVESNIHPQLRDFYSDKVPMQLVNSSLTAFVGFSWRWHWLVSILAEQQVEAGENEVRAWSSAATDAERAALPDFYETVRHLCERILIRFDASDPQALRVDEPFWRAVVMEYL